MIKFSICIPTYNRARLLEQSLSSIFNNQITDCFEVIIINNNSKDSTDTVVDRYKDKLNIVYKKNSRNIGAARNLIKAIELSKGEYVWMWSDDDIMIEGAADYLHDFLINHTDVDYIFYPRIITDKDLHMLPDGIQPKGYDGNLFFECGNALLSGLDGQMPGLLGYFSSTVVRRTHWDKAKKTLVSNKIGEFHYLKILLNAIFEAKCAILKKQGVYCRLNYRGFGHNSKVWFDQYIETFQYAKTVGYSTGMCDNAIKKLISTFSKMFIIDKARGNRNDNIFSALKTLGASSLVVKSQPWYILSFFPSKLLYSMMRSFFVLRKFYRRRYSP